MSNATLKHRKGKPRENDKTKKAEDDKKSDKKSDHIEPKFGPLPAIPKQRIWVRMVVIMGMLVIVYITSKQERVVNLAKVKDLLDNRKQDVKCSKDYFDEVVEFSGCVPTKCGRVVMDKLLTKEESEKLLDIAKRGLAVGGSDGGASILDLHSGALSRGKHFINIYSIPNVTDIFSLNDFALYIRIRRKIQEAVAYSFKLDSDKLYLTKPTFFSRLTAIKPVTPHDEYWHSHVDKESYQSFHYTSLIYLTDYNTDFQGGRFIFDDPENVSTIIEPRKGRVSAFTSGRENTHHVERVTSGTRFAVTVSFTCNKKYAISDPNLKIKKKV